MWFDILLSSQEARSCRGLFDFSLALRRIILGVVKKLNIATGQDSTLCLYEALYILLSFLLWLCLERIFNQSWIILIRRRLNYGKFEPIQCVPVITVRVKFSVDFYTPSSVLLKLFTIHPSCPFFGLRYLYLNLICISVFNPSEPPICTHNPLCHQGYSYGSYFDSQAQRTDWFYQCLNFLYSWTVSYKRAI